MHRILSVYKSLVILTLPVSGRLPLDIIMVTPSATRTEAKNYGHERYFTGKPCNQGHLSDRYTSSGNCVECGAKHAMLVSDAPKALPATDVPRCLSTNAKAKFCSGCEHSAKCSPTVKADVTPLRRATLKFHGFAPVTAEQARALSLAVYNPETPCPQCGQRSWRKMGGSQCGLCEYRDVRRMMNYEDAATWLPTECLSVPTNRIVPTNRDVWYAAIRERRSVFMPLVSCERHPDSPFSTGHNDCVECKAERFGRDYADAIMRGWQPEWDRDPVLRRLGGNPL